jgi:hypothetical protein
MTQIITDAHNINLTDSEKEGLKKYFIEKEELDTEDIEISDYIDNYDITDSLMGMIMDTKMHEITANVLALKYPDDKSIMKFKECVEYIKEQAEALYFGKSYYKYLNQQDTRVTSFGGLFPANS